VQKLKLFGRQDPGQQGCPGDVRAGRVQAGYKAERHRIAAGRENDRNCRCGRLGCKGRRRRRPDQYVDRSPNQLCRQRWQPIMLSVGPTIVDREIPTFFVARLAKALAK
jgi:hypothetical protein